MVAQAASAIWNGQSTNQWLLQKQAAGENLDGVTPDEITESQVCQWLQVNNQQAYDNLCIESEEVTWTDVSQMITNAGGTNLDDKWVKLSSLISCMGNEGVPTSISSCSDVEGISKLLPEDDDGEGTASFDDLSIELEKPEGSVQASQDVLFNTNIENSGGEEVNVENITYSISTADTGFEARIAHNESVDVAETGFSDEWRLRVPKISPVTLHYGDFLENVLVKQEDEDRPNAIDEIDEFKFSVTAWESYPSGREEISVNTLSYGEEDGSSDPAIYCTNNFPSSGGQCRDIADETGDWEVKVDEYNGCGSGKILVCTINEPDSE